MHATDQLGSRGLHRQFDYRQGGGVGREHGLVVDGAVQFIEESALDVEVLDDRLDNQVAVVQIGY